MEDRNNNIKFYVQKLNKYFIENISDKLTDYLKELNIELDGNDSNTVYNTDVTLYNLEALKHEMQRIRFKDRSKAFRDFHLELIDKIKNLQKNLDIKEKLVWHTVIDYYKIFDKINVERKFVQDVEVYINELSFYIIKINYTKPSSPKYNNYIKNVSEEISIKDAKEIFDYDKRIMSHF